ncbi:MAG: glycosyltransferase [Methyloprofundus sp.]|nr:glycosyltransferase [Methyloprofundus sp.]MBW6453481.1 glycosyltransferase [Methyloprofundus sp.]
MNKLSVGLIIPTKNAQAALGNVLNILKNSTLEFTTLIIDSSSDDQTVSIANKHNAKVIIIPQADFNHGATREYARKQLVTDIVVYLTQDAIPASADLVANLVKPLIEQDDVVVSYGRQVAQEGADIFEAFPRDYNYPDESQVRGIKDIDQYGVYTFFCSNSCAAYKNAALDEIGGFKSVLTNEDYFAVADLLQKGYKIAYAADAVVKHSHRYSLWQEFQRYFDTGYVRAENPVIQMLVGQAESRGVGFVNALLKRVWQENSLLIPYAVVQSLMKWFGYRIGFYGELLPIWLRKKLSQQCYYWCTKSKPRTIS